MVRKLPFLAPRLMLSPMPALTRLLLTNIQRVQVLPRARTHDDAGLPPSLLHILGPFPLNTDVSSATSDERCFNSQDVDHEPCENGTSHH